MAVDKPGVLGTRSSTVLASQLRAGGVVGAHTLPAHAMTRELIRKEPCTHMDVGAWIVEIRFLDAVSSEPREVRTVDLHEADVVSAGALAMRVVDGSWIEARFDPGHRIEELRRHAVALSRFLPARRSKAGCETQRKDGGCCNTSHGSPQTRNWKTHRDRDIRTPTREGRYCGQGRSGKPWRRRSLKAGCTTGYVAPCESVTLSHGINRRRAKAPFCRRAQRYSYEPDRRCAAGHRRRA